MNTATIILLILMFGSLLISAYEHGKPKEGYNNFWITFMASIIMLILYYYAGLFN